ncbi:MAG: DUF1499 domain-containing protein [Deltaproteobacteria bacterium]|nr:DUF1499 domain-containing protein [Deltaproteobacteria bacterium]
MKILILSWIFLTVFGCATSALERKDAAPRELPPCPDSPNCVSTRSKDPDRAMPPLPYMGTQQESMERLLQVLRRAKGSTLVLRNPTYLRAEFRSALFRFVDDVEFLFDDKERQIHFRSASRAGYYDLGVNRRRMKEISKDYRGE